MPDESRKWVQAILDNINDAILVQDADTAAILDVNATTCSMFGYTREEILSLSIGQISLGELPYTDEEALAWIRAAAAGEPQLFEWRARRKNGGTFWVEVNMRRAVVEGVSRILMVVRDITERKRAMEALHASEAFLDSIIEHSPYSTWISDGNGTLIRMNQVLRDTLHVTDEDLVGKYNVFSDALVEQQGLMPTVRRVFEKGETVRFTMRYDSAFLQRRADAAPTDLILDITVSAVLDPQGKVIHAIFQHFDVTEMARAAETIQRLNGELERRVVERTAELRTALKELESFSYTISHDLRAPLRAIGGFTHILVESQGERLDAEGIRLCALIRENIQRMGELIDDLLAFSRVGRADIRLADIDMTALARAVVDELAPEPRGERRDIRLETLPPATGDPALIRQVWMNLVGNALKFSAKRDRALVQITGGIRDGEAVYQVRDNGAGFDMQFSGKLFEVFQRLHTDQDFEGTGVGLAIVKRIIERHGGRVRAEATVDQGAAFSFSLPLRGVPSREPDRGGDRSLGTGPVIPDAPRTARRES
jgi:PAS domain S-box-containing protein